MRSHQSYQTFCVEQCGWAQTYKNIFFCMQTLIEPHLFYPKKCVNWQTIAKRLDNIPKNILNKKLPILQWKGAKIAQNKAQNNNNTIFFLQRQCAISFNYYPRNPNFTWPLYLLYVCTFSISGSVQCSALPISTMPTSARQCRAVECSAVQCGGVQCSAVQCSAVQCSAVECSAVQWSAM